MRRLSDGATLESTLTLTESCALPQTIRAPWPDAGEMLCVSLEPARRDIVFEEAATAAAAIADALAAGAGAPR